MVSPVLPAGSGSAHGRHKARGHTGGVRFVTRGPRPSGRRGAHAGHAPRAPPVQFLLKRPRSGALAGSQAASAIVPGSVVSPAPGERPRAAGGRTKRKPLPSPGSFRACSRDSGPKSDGSGRREKAEHTARGSVREPRRRRQGPPKPPGRRRGPGVVRRRLEARRRPAAGFVSAAAAAAGGRRSRAACGRPLLRRPRVWA